HLHFPWQNHPKSRASQFTLDEHDIPTVQQSALSSDRQAQTHAAFLECNCRFKKRSRSLFAQTWTRVVNLNNHMTVCCRRYTQHLPAGAGRFRCILEKICQNAFKLIGVCKSLRTAICEAGCVSHAGMTRPQERYSF